MAASTATTTTLADTVVINLRTIQAVTAAAAGASDGTTPPQDSTLNVTVDEVRVAEGGSLDYDRLVRTFGVVEIDAALIDRLERLTGKPAHLFLRRGKHVARWVDNFCDTHYSSIGLIFAHRDLNLILDAFEAGRPIYLYTGRGPSLGSLHLGHMVPFEFTRYLQEVLRAPLVVQLTDDEKFLKKGMGMEELAANTIKTAKDIIAFGFDPDLTYIFNNFAAVASLYPTVCAIQRALTVNQVRNCFGVSGSDCVGKMAFPAIQMAVSFASSLPHVLCRRPAPAPAGGAAGRKTGEADSADERTEARRSADQAEAAHKAKKKAHSKRKRVNAANSHYPLCLIPCGIDQDPYFRLTRDVARALGEPKPAVVHAKFLPNLDGHPKMSSTAATVGSMPPILLSDAPETVRKKMRRAYSGGRSSLEELRALGADLDVDVAFAYLGLFEEDESVYERVRVEYGAGRMTTGEVKSLAATAVSRIINTHQVRRTKVTDDTVVAFMTPRPLFPATISKSTET